MKAIIYSRVSSVSDRQSNDRQIIDLKRHAKLNDIEVIKVFEEKASGAKTRRPVMTEALEFAVSKKVDIVLVSELSRLGRNIYDVLNSCNFLIEHHINLYLQKEQITLLDSDGKPSVFAPILLAVLGTCAQMERENIAYRLNSGRRKFIEEGGKVGKPKGAVKSREKKREEYKGVIKELRRGTSNTRTAKLCDVSVSTVKRIRKEFAEDIAR